MKEVYNMSDKISVFFNDFSNKYDQFAFYQSHGTKYLSEIETDFLINELQIGNKKILDVGVGTGRNSEILLSEGGIVEGIDLSEGMMAKAKEKLKGKKINFTVADAGKYIPFVDANFDAVICMRVLKYIPTWQTTIKEISRVLTKNGTFVLEIANIYSIQYLGLYNANYFLFKPNEVMALLKQNGFEVTKICSGSRLPFPLYSKINNNHVLKIIIKFESFLNKVLPNMFFSRNIIIKCRKT